MKYRRPLLKTLAILGPMMFALSACATEPAYANNWCGSYYDPNCAYPYAYPSPYGDFFFFGDDRRFHHRFDHDFDDFHHRFDHDFHRFDHDFDHRFDQHFAHGPGGFNHGGVGHGGFIHRGFGGGGFGTGMFMPGGGGRGR